MLNFSTTMLRLSTAEVHLQLYKRFEFFPQDFSTKLNEMFHNDVAAVHVLNCWACMLRLLGEVRVFLFVAVNLFNKVH